MKRSICIILSLICVFLFSSCSFTVTLPDRVTIGSDTYKRAFEAALYPLNESNVAAEGTKISGIPYYKINNVPFDCYVAYDSSAEPHLYFADGIFDEAVSYYDSPENYNYYCVISNIHDESEAEQCPISDADSDIFDQLISFAQENDYDPLASHNNAANVRYAPIPDPDDWTKNEIHLYKESKDEAFTTATGYTFLIVENKLVLLHYYTFENEENPQMAIMDVPTELSDYFCELISNWIKS